MTLTTETPEELDRTDPLGAITAAAEAMAASGLLRSRRSGKGCTLPTVVQPTGVREDEMSDDGHHPGL